MEGAMFSVREGENVLLELSGPQPAASTTAVAAPMHEAVTPGAQSDAFTEVIDFLTAAQSASYALFGSLMGGLDAALATEGAGAEADESQPVDSSEWSDGTPVPPKKRAK